MSKVFISIHWCCLKNWIRWPTPDWIVLSSLRIIQHMFAPVCCLSIVRQVSKAKQARSAYRDNVGDLPRPPKASNITTCSYWIVLKEELTQNRFTVRGAYWGLHKWFTCEPSNSKWSQTITTTRAPCGANNLLHMVLTLTPLTMRKSTAQMMQAGFP